MDAVAEKSATAGAGAPPHSSAHPSLLAQFARGYAQAWQFEQAQRRLFLWVPVATGAGAILYLTAEREPDIWVVAAGFASAALGAVALRRRRVGFALCVLVAAVFAGLLAGAVRSAEVAAPTLDRIRILKLTGTIEEMDLRAVGARFVLRVDTAQGLTPQETPYRVRLTSRSTPAFTAGQSVALEARLLPPAQAVLPGGYDFARDAYFARIGAVGSVLGSISAAPAPSAADPVLQAFAAVDRARNALALRVSHVIGGSEGAIGAAMVTGKRDLLDDPTKDVIREAGIFHIITIAGVQMTLVAGIFFWGLRRLLALSPTLALNYPIKKWAAGLAIAGAILYDIGTGSRVGTDRALFMTLFLLGAVLFERQALSMRNLGFAALAVTLIEPEALVGASFQLSFAAVAALIGVHEARTDAAARAGQDTAVPKIERNDRLVDLFDWLRRGPGALLFATFCATSATASFMAANFHELSPYVLIGNPLTLLVIELFAVPAALLGSVLYPLGLDRFVWVYLGEGIKFILWAAGKLAAVPGATLSVPAFAPWAIVFLALALVSCVVWRSLLFRLSALPFLALGLLGATAGQRFDVAVAPEGDAIAVREASGSLLVLGKRANLFDAEQWLAADGDQRAAADALLPKGGAPGPTPPARCDALGCVATLADGRILSFVFDADAFAEDCRRADIIVTGLQAPAGCKPELVIDGDELAARGATTLHLDQEKIDIATDRTADANRPWQHAPAAPRAPAAAPPADGGQNADAPDLSPLD